MFSIKSNIEEFSKDLDDVARTQIPYATALTLNTLAGLVVAGEVDEVEKDFPTATPFTKKAFGFLRATKYNQFATIFTKDIQERYLEPYADQGSSVPTAGGAMVVPMTIPLNQYGNIPYRKIASLLKKSSVFYANKGDARFHNAKPFSGIFQREVVGTGPRGGKRTKLTVLAAMRDPWNVTKNFAFEQRAEAVINSNVEDAFEQALLKAMGSMK